MSLSNQAVSAGELGFGRCPVRGGGCAGGETQPIAPQHVEGTELVLEMLAKAMELGHLKDWAI